MGITAIDAATGAQLWRHTEKPPPGLCNLGPKDPKEQCLSTPDGGGEEACVSSGCCWHAEAAKCAVNISSRTPCGASPGDSASCAERGCCWDSDVPCWEFNHCCYTSVAQCFSGLSYETWWYGPAVVANGVVYAEAASVSAGGSAPRPGPIPVLPTPAPPSPPGKQRNVTIFAVDMKSGDLRQNSSTAVSGSGVAELPRPSVAGGRLLAAFAGGGYDPVTHRSLPPQTALEAFSLD
eukprot:gene9922-4264_t